MTPYYQRAGVTLYHADCRDVLPGLPLVDLLVTDPPYGVSITTTGMRRKQLAMSSIANDEQADLDAVRGLVEMAWARISPFRHAYVFGPFPLGEMPGACGACEIVWDKINTTMGDLAHPWAKQHEPIRFAMKASSAVAAGERGGLLARTRRGTVLRHLRPNGSGARNHPTEKPVPLLRELIEMSSRHGETVLDPFAGSGSTLVAAIIEGRQAVGIELDEPWCEVAAKRLDALTAQGVLFGGAA